MVIDLTAMKTLMKPMKSSMLKSVAFAQATMVKQV
jgi:hypothetical protein